MDNIEELRFHNLKSFNGACVSGCSAERLIGLCYSFYDQFTSIIRDITNAPYIYFLYDKIDTSNSSSLLEEDDGINPDS